MDPVVSKNAPPKPSKQVKPGNLKITVVEARNIVKKTTDWINPYCLIGPVDDDGNLIPSKASKTEVKKKTQRPSWNVTYNFQITAQFKGVALECWDEAKKEGKKPKFLGKVEFPPQILLDGRELTTWFSFGKRPGKEYAKEVVKGEIYLSILYLSNELRKELDPEGWAAEQAAAAAAAEKEGGGSKIQARAKNPEQINDIMADIRSAKIDAVATLMGYIMQTSYINSSEENLDHDYAKLALDKGILDAVIQGFNGDKTQFRFHAMAFIGKISELDTETLDLIVGKKIPTDVLAAIPEIPTNDEILYKSASNIFHLALHQSVKKEWLDGGILNYLYDTIKNNLSSAMVVGAACKSLNFMFSESESTTPSKKDIATALTAIGGIDLMLEVAKTFPDFEDVIEQAIPVLDILVEFSPPKAINNASIDLLLSILQKHRFPTQTNIASILARVSEDDDLAKHIISAGGIPLIVKLLGTESFLRSYEQKSREVTIKCLNKLATFDTPAVRDAGIAKVLQPAVEQYGAKFIIQIQAILLIKTLAKDEVCRAQLAQNGVSQLLTGAAAKHTVTRLQKLVQELKDTYLW